MKYSKQLKHSYKTQKNSLETRAVVIEIFIYVEIYRAAQNTGNEFKKNISLKGIMNKLFAGNFRANRDETNADMVQFTIR